jgi:hypothetical protein
LGSGSESEPDYIKNVMSNERTLQRNRIVFTKQKKTYDAYQRDIAILQVLKNTILFLFEAYLLYGKQHAYQRDRAILQVVLEQNDIT